MKTFHDKLVLITGAGSGIGRETAKLFAAQKAKVIIADINDKGAEQTKQEIEQQGGWAITKHLDVTDESAVSKLAEEIHSEFGALDVLINNAGIGSAGRFLDTSTDTWRKVMDVNLMGVVNGCHAFLPAMVKRGKGGQVVNLSSVAGFFGIPDMPVYVASKFAVQGFSESLRADMAEHGIGVTAICPGIINTPIVASTIMEGDMGNEKVRSKAQEFYNKRNYTPDRVAKAIVDAVSRNQSVRPVSPESWLLYWGKRFIPGLTELAAKSQRKLI